eukprot:CAMPEP_0194198806 /NCGR_PEP_ID=MMETSP0156-20130528/48_1 /TAXON_ID=33649 /ORGANISM="Thalassionema nitzschioides, Strain L26-B" /LENGTH=158 /DNA_ID=CAMNT_0038923631 /DNA_START=160 /DNA_END=632 /DNA_ORIENTATION=+
MAKGDNGIEGEYIVVIKKTEMAAMGGGLKAFGKQDAEALVAAAFQTGSEALLATSDMVEVAEVYSNTMQGFSAKMSSDAAEKLSELDVVDYVEQNMKVKLDAVTWGIDRVDQRDLPLSNSFNTDGDADGTGVYAYILDTGVQITHQEFEGRATWGANT